ncbi:MAG: KH domain-containing protein [Clostridia bacterium]|nr:KH domain-containing protein [Clostridia bacterium]
MKELLEYVVKSLVNNPENVRIEEAENGDEVVFSVYVDSGDMGRIIGKGGRIAKAVRALMKAASFKENKRVIVDIVD